MTGQLFLFVPVFILLVISSTTHGEPRGFAQQLCEMMNPKMVDCELNCPRLLKDGCLLCQCRNSICENKCAFGERCKIIRRGGAVYNKMTDMAVCVPDPRRNVPELPPTFRPSLNGRTFDNELGTCDFQGHCDATGRCPTVNSVCRSDGLCCKVTNGNTTPPMKAKACLAKPDEGHCRALGVQYVYNITTGKCESMIFGGCTTSLNSFATIKKCQDTCEYPCQKPTNPGRCRSSIPRFFFNDATEKCEPYDFGGCVGTDNFFMTQFACETHCKGLVRKRNSPNPVEDISNRDNPIVTHDDPTTTVTPLNDDGDLPYLGNPVNNAGDERDIFTNQIIDSFKGKNDDRTMRNNPFIRDGYISYRPRPNDPRTFSAGPDGDIHYMGSLNRLSSSSSAVRTSTATTTTPDHNNNLRALADRLRAANSQSSPYARPPNSYRIYNGPPQEITYKKSIEALRGYLTRG